MKIQREDSARTRERLIAAASEVFSKKDYNSATIADICERACANVAAVNYHFGDKETLYREAWRHAFQESIETHPADGGVSDHAPAEERLEGAIRGLLLRITDENNQGFFIGHREMANPTGLLQEVMKSELLPVRKRLETTVHELLGPVSTAERVRFCAVSIMNQCLHPMLRRSLDKNTEKLFGHRIDVAAFIDHVVRFSLGGIRAIAETAQKMESADYKKRKPKRSG
jgi:AcrR family transcriptional regulator